MRIAFDIYATGDVYKNQGVELGYFDIEFNSRFLDLLEKYDIRLEIVDNYVRSYLLDNASTELIYAKTYREGKDWFIDYTLRVNCEIPFKGFKKELNDIVLYTSSDFKSYAFDVEGIRDIKNVIKGIRKTALMSKERTLEWLDEKWKMNQLSSKLHDNLIRIVENINIDNFPIESIKQTSKDYYYTVAQSIKYELEYYDDIIGEDFYTFFDELEEEERDACYPNNLVG